MGEAHDARSLQFVLVELAFAVFRREQDGSAVVADHVVRREAGDVARAVVPAADATGGVHEHYADLIGVFEHQAQERGRILARVGRFLLPSQARSSAARPVG